MIQAIIGKKVEQVQIFLTDGARIPVTRITVGDNIVLQQKTQEKDGYMALQVGLDSRKHPTKASLGHAKKANATKVPFYVQEILVADTSFEELPKPGESIKLSDVLKEGDLVNVTGISKGKGYAGAVKRYGFRGGPRTHGQSDRERAPGSIGQTTTPGRVYRGKKMAGRMGHDQVTVKNLTVVGISGNDILIKGLVPGSVNTYISVKKVGENKKHVGILQTQPEETTKTAVVEGETNGTK